MPEVLSAEQAENTIFFSGQTHLELGRLIADHMGVKFGSVELGRFESTDLKVRFLENLRGRDVIIFQPHAPNEDYGMSVSDSFHQHLEMIYAVENNAANRRIAFAPVLAGARQDRMARRGEGVSADLTLRLLQTAGATEVVTTDIHSMQSLSVFRPHPTHLTALGVLAEAIAQRHGKEREGLIVASADPGRYKMAEYMGKELGVPYIMLDKQRRRDGSVYRYAGLAPEAEGQTVVLVDDMIGGGDTIYTAGEILKKSGAVRKIAAATHAWLSGNAVETLARSAIDEIFVTDTLPISSDKVGFLESVGSNYFTVVPTARMHAKALIQMLIPGGSVSEEFQGRNLS